MADGDKLEKPAMPTSIPAKASRFDVLIEDWFNETMHGPPVSNFTHVYNHVRAAVDDLKRRFAKEN